MRVSQIGCHLLVTFALGLAFTGCGQTMDPDYHAMAISAAINAEIDPDLFQRQIQQESGFNPQAESSAGAEGIAQFMPETAASLGINPWDPPQALAGAAQLMSHYKARYGNYKAALAAYNCGSACVNSAVRSCYQYWLNCTPSETQAYVRIILKQGD